MSDVFEGPGWWLASDGKWYHPDAHPEESYRTRFAPISPPEIADIAQVDAVAEPSVDGWTPLRDETQLVPSPEFSVATTHQALAGAPDVSDSAPEPSVAEEVLLDDGRLETNRAGDPQSDSISAMAEASEFAIATNDETQPLLAVVHTDPASTAAESTVVTGTAAVPSIAAPVADSEQQSDTPPKSVALVTVPEEQTGGYYREVGLRDWLLATLVFAAGVALIVGSFLTWTETAVFAEKGWERLDGLVTIGAGIVGSTAAGPLIVGYRHYLPRLIMAFAAIISIVVLGLLFLDTARQPASIQPSFGIGFFVVFAGAIGMTLAALGDRRDVSP